MKTSEVPPIIPGRHGSESAFPFAEQDAAFINHHGLTKRELFAAMAMQGLIASFAGAPTMPPANFIASQSVQMADATLAALEKPR